MATITTAAALVAVCLLLPAVIILWATESSRQRALRMRRRGHSYRVIAARVGRAPSTVYRWCNP